MANVNGLPSIFSFLKKACLMKNTLKVERAILNLTQGDLAIKIGVSRQTINSIESNRYVPSTLLSLKLSEVFSKPVNDFFRLEEDD